MLDKILDYFLTRFGFRRDSVKRAREEDEENEMIEPSQKQRKTSGEDYSAADLTSGVPLHPVTLNIRPPMPTREFLCPAPNWRRMPKRTPMGSFLHRGAAVTEPNCSWFGEAKDDVVEISDSEDGDVMAVWQDINTFRKYPVYDSGSRKRLDATKEKPSSSQRNGSFKDDDIEFVKVIEPLNKRLDRSKQQIVFQTPTSRITPLNRITVDLTGSTKSPLLLQRLKTPHLKCSHSAGSSRYSNSEDKRGKLALSESFRLEDKLKYSELLQSFTKVQVQSNFAPASSFRNTRAQNSREPSPKQDQLSLTLSFRNTVNTSSIPSDRRNVKREVIDLTKPEVSRLVPRKHVELRKDKEHVPYLSNRSEHRIHTVDDSIYKTNSLQDVLKQNNFYQEEFLPSLSDKYNKKKQLLKKQEEEEKLKASHLQKREEKMQLESLERLTNYLKLTDAIFEDSIVEEKLPLPELTPEMEKVIRSSLMPKPPNEILVDSFGLPIKRHDMQTLAGLNWLNDEVINFYMELLKERGKLANYPTVYCFNTFFYPRLLSGGHAALKRWTRKVDIFSHDLIIVPVHLGVHWCMAAIDFRKKTIKYYDSMGSPNNKCLQSLMKYLQDESLDKKKVAFDAYGWKTENVQNIPQQMNGSDCGMFSCMYAEYISRNADITFTQQDMPYFRRKMVYEIVTRKLLM